MTRNRAKYLLAQARYNASPKGLARKLRYEEKHPERKFRLGSISGHKKGRCK